MADGDTETAILDAALAEVLAHGIRRTTMSDIARRCGIARQTLYRYWPDASSVFAALTTRELLAVLPAEDDAGTDRGLDGFVDLVVTTAGRIRRMPLVDRLRATDPELLSRYILHRLGVSQRAILGVIAARIAAGQSAGVIRAGDPARLAAVLLLTAQSAVQSAPLVAEWIDDAAWDDELARLVRGYLRVDEP